jgi:hypothetical protein
MTKALWLCVALIPSMALAAGTSTGKEKKGSDVICRDQEVTGSRLESKRVCMTRDQWEQSRRMMREEIERGQNNQIPPQGH